MRRQDGAAIIKRANDMNVYYVYMGLLFIALVLWAVIALHSGSGGG